LVLSDFLATSEAQSHQTKSVSDRDAFVFKSTDGGISWSAIIGFDAGISAHYGNVIVVDPLTSSTVYVGTNNGLIKSTDGGGTWAEITVGLNDRSIKAIAVYPQNPSILYILAFNQWGTIYRSTDAGKHWEQVTLPLQGAAYSLAFDPLNPSVLYAGGSDPDMAVVYKTTDGGGSWSSVRLPVLGLAFTDKLALDPMAPTNLYASNHGGNNRGGLSKSTDAGRTWRETNLTETIIHTLTPDPHTSSMLYVTCSDGILKSSDGGDHWIDLSNGFNRSRLVQCLTIDPTSTTTLFAGTFDSLFKTTDGGLSWASASLNRNILSVAIDPGNPGTVYAGSIAEPPQIKGVSVEGKKLIVEGEGFHDGAKIYLDRERQKTVNDAESPHTKLIGKKAGKWIARGQSVSLQVIDSDGVSSAPFLFTRSND